MSDPKKNFMCSECGLTINDMDRPYGKGSKCPRCQETLRVLVLAGSYDQYQHYLRESGNTALTHKYIATGEDLRGYAPHSMKIVKYGTWYGRELDIELIEFIDKETGE
jgi:hypothetical protein